MVDYVTLKRQARGPKEVEQQPKPLSTHEKLKNALAKRDFWRKAAADPAQTPSSAAAASDLAKSWDAAALAYQKALKPPNEDADESNPSTAVNLTLPPDLARAFQGPKMERPPKSQTSQSASPALSRDIAESDLASRPVEALTPSIAKTDTIATAAPAARNQTPEPRGIATSITIVLMFGCALLLFAFSRTIGIYLAALAFRLTGFTPLSYFILMIFGVPMFD